VSLPVTGQRMEVVIRRRPGSDVYLRPQLPEAGARSEGLRVLRSRAETGGLRLLLEGRGGKTYALFARSPRRPRSVSGVAVKSVARGAYSLEVSFDGRPDAYVRREVVLPLE